MRHQKINQYHPHLRDDDNLFSAAQVSFSIKLYNEKQLLEFETTDIQEALKITQGANDLKTWINVKGLHKDVVYKLGKQFNIHKLFIDDILSLGQRAKLDDIDDGIMYILIPTLEWNDKTKQVTKEQLSIIIGKTFIITFQDETPLLHFGSIQQTFRNPHHPMRNRNVDFLLYHILDNVIDDYFNGLDALADHIEHLEDLLNNKKINNKNYLETVSKVRKEVFQLKRIMSPVRDVINTIWVKENDLIEERNKKYFKDILDHIILAIEYNENYRENTVNLQDIYMNQLNAKSNEVMKTLTVVTTILAPCMLIASVYGMNFEKMPLLSHTQGFYIVMSIAVACSLGMIWYFKAKKWY